MRPNFQILRVEPEIEPEVPMAVTFLTDRFIRSIQPRGGRLEYWDSVVGGLVLRVSSQAKTWSFAYSSPEDTDAHGNHRRRRVTLGTFPRLGLAEARLQASTLREKVQAGEDPVPKKTEPKPRGVIFADLAADYLERYAKPKKTTWRTDAWAMRTIWVPAFGTRKVDSLTVKDIRLVLEEIMKRGPTTANRVHGILRKALTWGVLHHDLASNPARLIPTLHKGLPRERVLSPDEVRRIWHAFQIDPNPAAVYFPLRLVTAQRAAQLGRLNASNLVRDGADLWWNVPAAMTKTRKPYRIYLSPLAQELLAPFKPNPAGWYFRHFARRMENGGMVDELTKRIRRVSGVEHWQPRDLRRTAATWMAQRGVPRFVLKRVLGHADSDITAVYDLYTYDKEVKQAVLTLESAIREAIGEAPALPTAPPEALEKPAHSEADSPSFLDLYP
jgi:integrase